MGLPLCCAAFGVLPLSYLKNDTKKDKQLICRVVVRFIWNNACEGILSVIQTIIKKEGRWIDIESCNSPRKCIRVGKQKWKAGRLGPNQTFCLTCTVLNIFSVNILNQVICTKSNFQHFFQTCKICNHWVYHLLGSASKRACVVRSPHIHHSWLHPYSWVYDLVLREWQKEEEGKVLLRCFEGLCHLS